MCTVFFGDGCVGLCFDQLVYLIHVYVLCLCVQYVLKWEPCLRKREATGLLVGTAVWLGCEGRDAELKHAAVSTLSFPGRRGTFSSPNSHV